MATPDPHDFRAPLTSEEKLRVEEMVTQQLPEILALCEKAETESKNSFCPMCNAPLLTAVAQRCFQCGLDWHGRSRPESRFPCDQGQTTRGSKRSLYELLVADAQEQAEWMVRNSRWSEEWAWEVAEVPPEEVKVLKQLISESLRHRNDQIIGVRRFGANALGVTTGWQGGPLMGCGCDTSLKRIDGRWVVVEQSGWVS